MSKSGLAILALVGTLLIACGIFFSSPFGGANVANAAPIQVQQPNEHKGLSWEYARLEYTSGANGFKFTYGDDIYGRNGTNIENLMKLLNNRIQKLPTLANLLNEIGGQGWELVFFHEHNSFTTWGFKRAY